MGSPSRDGQFEFTVTGIKKAAEIGDKYVNKTAQGQFVIVSVTVRNVGDEARMFDASSQYLFDTQGTKYDASTDGVAYMGQRAQSFLEQINPGNRVKGYVIFDVPKGLKLDHIELHDSPFSGGVDVKL